MKRLKIKYGTLSIVLLALFFGSCTEDILDESPKSVFTPDFFKSELGVKGGLTSLYANLRYIYGQPYYPSINTASGIIENAAEVGLSADLISEAQFFRGFYYFLLVQTYGGVPLDLGAGELKFNTEPSRGSVRNTVPEVYTRAIFPDLLAAVNDLPDNPRLVGAATKTVARLYLAKAYLTYGWWLQNPNNIPTYPEAARTDPDGHDANWYFQQAYDLAAAGIDNPGPFGLQDTFYEAHLGENDRNNEMLLFADHTEASAKYNGADLGYSNANGADNAAVWMVTWNYTEIRSSDKSTVQREAAQDYGRPWTRMAPTINVFKNTFAEKELDSRYDGTFVTTYRANYNLNNDDTPSYANANGLPVGPGDKVLSFLDEDDAGVVYPSGAGASNVGGGELPGRADYVINPSGISRVVYPGLWKLGTYRTDNNGGLGQPNGASTRPFNIAKFTELYFVAAEAVVKGAVPQAGKSARELINVVRARAGKWSFDRAENVERTDDNSTALTLLTPPVIDLDYILAERSREFFGEGYRWFDLTRTQKWADYASTYEIAGSNKGDHNAVIVNRTIEPYFYLRPIPQDQIDSMDGTEAEKAVFQNPGY